MNLLDLAILGIVLVSAFLAFYRGFIREVFSILGWVVAALVTLYTFDYVKPLARELVSERLQIVADIGAALAIFLVVLVVVSVGTSWIAKRLHNTDFKPLDRSLGFVFGAFRGLVLLCLAYLLINWGWKLEEQPKWLREARSMPVLAYGAGLLTKLVPDDFLKGAKVGVREVGERAKQASERERAFRRLNQKPPTSSPNGSGSTSGDGQ